MLKSSVSIEQQIRQWVQAEIEEADSVDLPSLANDALDHFRTDEAFVHALMEDAIRPRVYDIARHVLSETRGAGNPIELGDEIVTGEEFKKRSRNMSAKFARWMEHAGEDGHIRFTKMRKPQLITAASERKKRGLTELKIAEFEQRVAAGMKSDNETVDQRYSAEDLQSIWKQIEEKWSTNGRV